MLWNHLKHCALLSALQGKLLFFSSKILTGSMQSIKHKSEEELAYFICQLQTCARTIYRNSGTWCRKIYLLPPAKLFDSKWKLVGRDEGTKELRAIYSHSVCHRIRESPWRGKKMLHIFALCTAFWLWLLKFLVLSFFCQKRSCTIKVT